MGRYKSISQNDLASIINKAIENNEECIIEDYKIWGGIDFNFIELSDRELPRIVFSNVKFTGTVKFDTGNKVKFGELVFEKNTKIKDGIKLYSGFIRDMVLDGVICESVYYADAVVKKFHVFGGYIGRFEVFKPEDDRAEIISIGSIISSRKKVRIGYITIWEGIKGIMRFYNIRIDRLELEGRFDSTECYFEGIDLNNLSFKKFSNSGKSEIGFFNINASHGGRYDELEIYNSSFEKVKFYNSNFCFKDNKFYDCDIVSMKTNNTKWPKDIITNNFWDVLADDKRENIIIREVLKQFRIAFSNNGDRIEELNYYALEMDAYGKTLSWKKDKEKWLIFKLNKWSNNHGLNWLRPLGLILTVAVITYLPLLIVEGWQYWFSFFEFILPTHKFDFIQGEVFGWFYPIDLISRIIIGYLIYQMIRAFRRYAMK